VDSPPKTQRSGREKTKCKHTVSNPNYSTGLGWKWGKRGESSPFYKGNPKFSPPMAARPRASARTRGQGPARTRFLPHPRVTADAGGRPDGHFHPKTSVMTSLIWTPDAWGTLKFHRSSNFKSPNI
jgi:hypothetical protein